MLGTTCTVHRSILPPRINPSAWRSWASIPHDSTRPTAESRVDGSASHSGARASPDFFGQRTYIALMYSLISSLPYIYPFTNSQFRPHQFHNSQLLSFIYFEAMDLCESYLSTSHHCSFHHHPVTRFKSHDEGCNHLSWPRLFGVRTCH